MKKCRKARVKTFAHQRNKKEANAICLSHNYTEKMIKLELTCKVAGKV